jgi:hypothetical protein
MLDPEEIILAGRILSRLDEIGSEEALESARHLKQVIDQLVRLRQVVIAYPSIILSHKVAGQNRDVYTLTDAICSSNPYTIEAYMPTRAVVGRAYTVAKFNFFRLLSKIVRYHVEADDDRDGLINELSVFVLQSVYTVIAEDILISIASNQELEVDLRRKATYLLTDLWENRTSRSVKDFFPFLESIWSAKTRVHITYGTLSGTTEILALMREGCVPEVIDYFTRDMISEDERQALLELVFNSTYEELEMMRKWMKVNGKQMLGADDVASLFKIPLSGLHQTISSPKDMFFTFRERQVLAYHRAMKDQAGPKKTAEEYLMIYYLGNNDVQAPENSAEESYN